MCGSSLSRKDATPRLQTPVLKKRKGDSGGRILSIMAEKRAQVVAVGGGRESVDQSEKVSPIRCRVAPAQARPLGWEWPPSHNFHKHRWHGVASWPTIAAVRLRPTWCCLSSTTAINAASPPVPSNSKLAPLVKNDGPHVSSPSKPQQSTLNAFPIWTFQATCISQTQTIIRVS